MKTLDDICDRFEKDLEDLGATTYIYNILDPDSHAHRWGTGVNLFWMLGSLEILKDQIKDDFREVNTRYLP